MSSSVAHLEGQTQQRWRCVCLSHLWLIPKHFHEQYIHSCVSFCCINMFSYPLQKPFMCKIESVCVCLSKMQNVDRKKKYPILPEVWTNHWMYCFDLFVPLLLVCFVHFARNATYTVATYHLVTKIHEDWAQNFTHLTEASCVHTNYWDWKCCFHVNMWLRLVSR